MNIPTLFLTAIITPVLLITALLVPSYSSVYGAAYLTYANAAGANPMSGKFLDIFTVLDSYQTLLDYWLTNRATLDFVSYTLPIVVLPAIGCLFALWLTYKIARRLLNFFQLSASI